MLRLEHGLLSFILREAEQTLVAMLHVLHIAAERDSRLLGGSLTPVHPTPSESGLLGIESLGTLFEYIAHPPSLSLLRWPATRPFPLQR